MVRGFRTGHGSNAGNITTIGSPYATVAFSSQAKLPVTVSQTTGYGVAAGSSGGASNFGNGLVIAAPGLSTTEQAASKAGGQ